MFAEWNRILNHLMFAGSFPLELGAMTPIFHSFIERELVQDLLAKMIANITASQCLIVRQAQLHAEGKLTDAHAALAKGFTTAKMRETVSWAREILGGNGITLEYPVIRHMNNLESVLTYEGTHEVHTLVVGGAITGTPAFR